LLGSLLACTAESASRDDDAATPMRDAGRTPPPVPWPIEPFPDVAGEDLAADVLAAREELGRLLFYDPILSLDRETACATCHSEIWGMGDALARSIGHGAGLLSGPGRRGGPEVRRNSPQLWNLAFRKSLLWDGRSVSLEEQALFPLIADDELARDPDEVADELGRTPGYVARFAAAFPEDPAPSVEHLSSALAAFQRTLVSRRALYDGYIAGDALALTDDQVDGMFRFAEHGCPDCHTPPLFESEAFFDRELPESSEHPDEGRMEVTENAADRRAFRVASLRNVAFSDPYFHDGSVRKLDDAVRHELSLSGRTFDDEDIARITLFLHDALKDESKEPDRPRSVPSGLKVPIDGTFIDR
jgi:cytochrome c peroxidase